MATSEGRKSPNPKSRLPSLQSSSEKGSSKVIIEHPKNSISRLPDEVILQIVEELSCYDHEDDWYDRKAKSQDIKRVHDDIKTLCLVSDRFQDIAVEVLFRTVRSSDASWNKMFDEYYSSHKFDAKWVINLKCSYIPVSILHTGNLRTLTVTFNNETYKSSNLPRLSPNALPRLTTLRIYEIGRSEVASQLFVALVNACRALEKLKTNISIADMANIQAINRHRTTLKTLVLTGNGYGGDLIGMIQGFTALERLEIHQNSICDVTYRYLLAPPQLAGPRIISYTELQEDQGTRYHLWNSSILPAHGVKVALRDALPVSIVELTLHLNAPNDTNIHEQLESLLLKELLADWHGRPRRFRRLQSINLHYPREEYSFEMGDVNVSGGNMGIRWVVRHVRPVQGPRELKSKVMSILGMCDYLDIAFSLGAQEDDTAYEPVLMLV